jgi:hypothetical protein
MAALGAIGEGAILTEAAVQIAPTIFRVGRVVEVKSATHCARMGDMGMKK